MFFASDASLVHFSYRRYLENRLRETFGFDGTPIRLVFRDRASVKLPRRKKTPLGAGQGRRDGPSAAADPPVALMAGPRVAVVGAGAWGTTLAAIVARREPVLLLCHSAEAGGRDQRDAAGTSAACPAIDLPDGARRDGRPGRARVGRRPRDLRGAVAAPAIASRPRVAPHIAPTADVLSVVKGLERGTLLRMSEVIAEAGGIAPERRRRAVRPQPRRRDRPGPAGLGRRRRRRPRRSRSRIAERLGRREFRLYVNRDILGVELCGALKNIVAIAAGAADGLGFGDNGKAGLMTRGLAEMMRLGSAAGANPLTFAGLAGIGDVIATCGSTLSRNHRLGEELAAGRPWAEIEATLPGTAEGAYTVDAALALADRLGRRDAHRPRGPPRAVRGQERPALPRSTCCRANRRTSWRTRLGCRAAGLTPC